MNPAMPGTPAQNSAHSLYEIGGPASTFSEETIRAALRREVAKGQNDSDALLIDELGLCRGSARIDLAVVDGQLHGYEIKSERDNLRRLGIQADIYSRVFDRVTLVCDVRHISRALDIIPTWWAVLRIESAVLEPEFKTVRLGRENPDRDARALAEFLWRDEAMSLLEQRHALRGMRSKPRSDLWDRICELFGTEEVSAAVRAHLKATGVKRGRSARQW